MTTGDKIYFVLKAALVSYIVFAGIQAARHHLWVIAVVDGLMAAYFTWSTFRLLRKSRQLRGE